MEILKNIRGYLIPEELEINVTKDVIHIVNFISIGEISRELIIVRAMDKSILIKGADLLLSKLMDDEVLIKGVFKSIEFRG